MNEVFYQQIKDRDSPLKHMYTNVAVFYKIPSPRLRKEYTFSEIKEMYIDILYYNKKMPKPEVN